MPSPAVARQVVALALVCAAAVSCASSVRRAVAPPAGQVAGSVDLLANPEATVVQVIGFHLPEGAEPAWIAACRRLARAATAAGLDANWLIHRRSDEEYYLVSFGSREEFADPASVVAGFARRGGVKLADALAELHAVPYEAHDEIWEQHEAWSTTAEMNSLTHPGVDQRTYHFAAGDFAAADLVLTGMAELLARAGYPYPTEGFHVSGSAGAATVVLQVVTFFGDRDDYRARGRPAAYLAARGLEPEWRALENRLVALATSRDRSESRYVHELSYDPWLAAQENEEGS
ncbi:MAG: hypothetical protein AB7G12_16825 [Thermoanaerobaculia bacterium]